MTKNSEPAFDHEDSFDKALRLIKDYRNKYPKAVDPKGFMQDIGPEGMLAAFKKANGKELDFWYDEDRSANWRVITAEV